MPRECYHFSGQEAALPTAEPLPQAAVGERKPAAAVAEKT